MKQPKGYVAAGHEDTVRVAAEVLRAGGNAIDASIAALFMTFLSEPCMSSVGGGGFANIRLADGTSKVLDFFCQTPSSKGEGSSLDFYPFTIDFGDSSEEFHIGMASQGVPGTIKAAFAMHEWQGTMPMQELAYLTIKGSKEGVPVDAFQAMDFIMLEKMLEVDPRSREIYFRNGKLLEKGDLTFMPALGDFLDFITREGPDEFYKGEIASTITRHNKERGGLLTYDDMAGYDTRWVDPIEIAYKGKTVLTTPYPSLGGALIAVGMGEMGKKNGTHPLHTAPYIEEIYECLHAMNLAKADPDRLFEIAGSYGNVSLNPKWGSTTHFNILDGNGNAVSMTLSNGEGSGYVIPGTDNIMNNMLGEAALMPKGFFSWNEKSRLNSLMTPTLVVGENGTIETITGTGGAGRIPLSIFQVLDYLSYGIDAQEAVDAPRMYLFGNHLDIEPGYQDNPNLPGNVIVKTWEGKNMFFGGVHTIHKTTNGYVPIGDSRRFGIAETVY